MYVVADDELHLGVFSTLGRQPGQLIRLVDGVLPDSNAARKLQKPDFEALALIPAFPGFPHGAMLAIGSGSRPNRRAGVLLGLDPQGGILGPPRSVDLSFLLVQLEQAFAEVNIEGAVAVGDELILFQRGNKRHADNALVRYRLQPVLDALNAESADAIKPSEINGLDLGRIEGIPLCFTDAATLPDGEMVFSAVAEDTADAFHDGACVGAAIGIVDRNGSLRRLCRLDRPHKVEGISARAEADRVELLLVTDFDDPGIPAMLFSATMTR